MATHALMGCSTNSTEKRIRVKDGKRKAIFLNPGQEPYVVIQVDDCVVKNGIACDYVVDKPHVGQVFIELKGMDIDHAVDQLHATAEMWKQNGYLSGSTAALVVCSRVPAFDTKVSRLALRFAKKFKGPLHVISGDREFHFEKVLRFDGPGA